MDRKPDQLHIAPASVGAQKEEYNLEDILKEFRPQGQIPNDSPEEKKAPGVTGDTQVFTPITETPPMASLSKKDPENDNTTEAGHIDEEEEVIKIFHSAKGVSGKPLSTPRPPIQILDSPNESSDRDTSHDPSQEDPAQAAEGDSPQDLLHKTQRSLRFLMIQRVFLAITALSGMFLLLYTTKLWDFLPALEPRIPSLTLILLAVGMVLSVQVLWQGIKDLFTLRISLYTIGTISGIVCLVYNLSHPDIIYAPLVTTQLFFLLQAKVNENAAFFYTAKTVVGFQSPMGVCNAPRLPENTASLRRDPGNVSDFMKHLKVSSLPQDLLCVYASILLAILPILAFFLSKDSALPYLQVWLLLLLGAVPYAGMLCFFKPFRSLAKKLSRYRGALCSWYGAQIFGGKHTIILRDGDLFPRKGITSNGMKLYNGHNGAKVTSYALAALKQADSPLCQLFENLLREQYGKHSKVGEHRFYDHGGVGVEIGEDIVLVGNLSFIRSMGVHMPAGTRVRQAVYVSINGELAGIFALRYKPNASTHDGLRDVLANRNFSVILATRDFLITPELIAAKYTLPTDTMGFPDYTERLRLSETNPEQAMSQGALIAEDTFGALAVTVAAGRTLKNCSLATTAMTLCAGALGLLLTILLIAWSALGLTSPMHIAAFQLLWGMITAFVGLICLHF